MPITASHLRHALKRIAQASSHPNALAYKIQLEGATQKYLVRETENGEIDLPPPSSATMLERGADRKEPAVAEVGLGCGGENAMDLKTAVKEPRDEGRNRGFGDVTSRRFMGLALFDTTSIIGFPWEGKKSDKYLRGV